MPSEQLFSPSRFRDRISNEKRGNRERVSMRTGGLFAVYNCRLTHDQAYCLPRAFGIASYTVDITVYRVHNDKRKEKQHGGRVSSTVSGVFIAVLRMGHQVEISRVPSEQLCVQSTSSAQ